MQRQKYYSPEIDEIYEMRPMISIKKKETSNSAD